MTKEEQPRDSNKERKLYNFCGQATTRAGYVLCSGCKEGKFIFEDADYTRLHLITCPVCRELFSITFDATTNLPILSYQGNGYGVKPSEEQLAKSALDIALRLPPNIQNNIDFDYLLKKVLGSKFIK